MLTRKRDILEEDTNDKQDGKQRMDVVIELESRGGGCVVDGHMDHGAADEGAKRELAQ